MADHKMVYQQEAVQYQRLISREDYLDNLLPAIERITPLQGKDLVDLGAGTGRLAHLLAPWVSSVHALDLSPHMLGVAAELLRHQEQKTWQVTAGDHRWIPLADNSADLIVSGWSICYLMVWEGEKWKKEVEMNKAMTGNEDLKQFDRGYDKAKLECAENLVSLIRLLG